MAPDFKVIVHAGLSLRYPASKTPPAKAMALSTVSVSSTVQSVCAISLIALFLYSVRLSAKISLHSSTHSVQMLTPGPAIILSSAVTCLQKLHTVSGLAHTEVFAAIRNRSCKSPSLHLHADPGDDTSPLNRFFDPAAVGFRVERLIFSGIAPERLRTGIGQGDS